VNSTVDAIDAAPGNGICATGGGVCTLRAAVIEANALGGADTINVPPGTFLLTIDGDDEGNAVSGDLDIKADLTIVGSGISATILDANGLERMFDVNNGTASISDLTIQGGDVRFNADSGGGINTEPGTNLTMTDVVVQNNLADTGGGMSVGGTITMVDVTIDNNTVDGSGGGVRISAVGNGTLTAVTISNNDALGSNGGGILQEGTSLIATNVTFSGNTSANRGGGLHVLSSATLQNVTFSNNSAAGRGGGFMVFGGSLTLRNTLVAGNTAPQDPDVNGTVTSLGNNLIGNSTGGAGFVASDILDVAPSLGGLADNGGPTQTHALLVGSRGIDEGTGTGGPPTDQRGVSRPLDGDGDTIASFDIGAFELVATDISGLVYHDANTNNAPDAGELGVGTVWVKLLSGGSVIRVVQADPDTGAYTFLTVADGSYSAIVDDNSNPADATPTEPVNWLFQNPATGSLSVTVAGADVTDRDFGLTFDFDLGTDCACGYEDGLFTQVSITVDGNMGDWATVFSDGDNNACDATDDTDLDHSVQSTGRNLLRTAVTWDATYFSMWTQRVGQSSNTQNFVYYADTNADGIQQDGEPVVVAKWQGNTGNVTLELYTYDDLGSGGDPVLDSNGFADGYSMPGDLNFVKTLTMPDGSGQGSTTGNTDGTQMEWTIEWTELGVPVGSAIGWHIGSTNSNPAAAGLGAQIDDNLGGCGGQCTGTNQFAGILPTPIGGGSGEIVYAAHVFTNTGNGTDLFDFTWSWTGDFAPDSVTFYRDLGTVGQYDPGIDLVLTDTDADTDPDTGNLGAGASFDLLIGIALPAGNPTGSTTVTTMATSNFVPGCGGTVTPVSGNVEDTASISPRIVKRGFQADGTPHANGATLPSGMPVKFLIYFANHGGALTDLSVQDVLDPLHGYKAGSMKVDDTL